MLKKRWLYIAACFVVPHLTLLAGVYLLSREDIEHKTFGLRICKISTYVLVIGSLAYYIFYTPVVGLD